MKQEVNRKHAADKWALDDVVMITEVRLDLQYSPHLVDCNVWFTVSLPAAASWLSLLASDLVIC